MNSAAVPALAMALSLLLGACSLAVAEGRPTTAVLERVRVAAATDANWSSATPLDLVFVYDPEIAAALPGTSAQWFGQKAALLGAFSTGIEVVSLQIPPASASFDVRLPARHRKAIRVLSYAGYSAPQGQLAGDLTARSCVEIVLAAREPRYEACR